MKELIIALLFLGGCAASQHEVIVTHTVPVNKTVVQACIDKSKVPLKPEYATSTIKKTDKDEVKVKAMRIELLQREDYENKIEALLTPCETITQ